MKRGVIALLAFILLGWVFFNKSQKSEKLPKTQESKQQVVLEPVENERLHFLPQEQGKYSSKLVDALNIPEATIEKDLALLKNVFLQVRAAYKGNPVGSHKEILSYLTGNNPNQVAYIPPNHPAIRNGELFDRWGTPFYFHQISGSIMEVRSAGPDKRHWNSDDHVIR